MKTISDGPGHALIVTEPGDRVALLDLEGHRITDVKTMGEDWTVVFDIDRAVPGFTYGIFDDADRLAFQSQDQGVATAWTRFTLTDRPTEASKPRRCYDTRAEMRMMLILIAVALALVAIGVVIGAMFI